MGVRAAPELPRGSSSASAATRPSSPLPTTVVVAVGVVAARLDLLRAGGVVHATARRHRSNPTRFTVGGDAMPVAPALAREGGSWR